MWIICILMNQLIHTNQVMVIVKMARTRNWHVNLLFWRLAVFLTHSIEESITVAVLKSSLFLMDTFIVIMHLIGPIFIISLFLTNQLVLLMGYVWLTYWHTIFERNYFVICCMWESKKCPNILPLIIVCALFYIEYYNCTWSKEIMHLFFNSVINNLELMSSLFGHG